MDPEVLPAPVRVAIAASHPGLRAAIERVVALEHELALVAVAGDHRGAARALLQHRPDVLIVALAGALRDGGAAIRELCTMAPATALVVAATAPSDTHYAVARAAGAAAFVSLDGTADHLGEVIGRVAHESRS